MWFVLAGGSTYRVSAEIVSCCCSLLLSAPGSSVNPEHVDLLLQCLWDDGQVENSSHLETAVPSPGCDGSVRKALPSAVML